MATSSWRWALPSCLSVLLLLGADSSDCAECHPSQARTWALSGHAEAWTSPVFQASYGHWPDPWCLGCHRPSGADAGVDCVACHLRDGEVLTTLRPTDLGLAAHDMRRADLDSPAFCGTCHEFAFPRHDTEAFAYSDAPLQTTLTEWHTWDGEETCQSCHMPDGAHGRTREERVARLREAVRAEVIREGDGLSVTLSAHGAGHHLPTGDPFRRLVVEVCEDPDCRSVVDTARASRFFRITDTTWTQRADHTLAPGSSHTFRLADGVAWRLWYYLGDPRFHDRLDPDRVRVMLHEGRVADSP